MATNTPIRSSVAAALLLAAFLAAGIRPAAAQPGSRSVLSVSPAGLNVVKTRGGRAWPKPAYGWPVKPFDRQHPVRGFLNDPRIGSEGGRAFHFGIDVAAPDGTPVYAVAAGDVWVNSPRSIAVVAGPGHVFGYWHIVPVVRSYQHVALHQLLGRIAPGWGHVHFAERLNGEYVNPLRPGGIGPYTDPISPDVSKVSFVRLGSGALQILATAHDTTWPSVPGPWANEPVAPALLEWRLIRNGHALGGWHVAADFGTHMLDKRLFSTIYAPSTTQNHQGLAGNYCFYLERSWKPADGSYRLEVAASDNRDNRTVARVDFTVENGNVAESGAGPAR